MMTSFIPLTQLNGAPSATVSGTQTKKHVCMFCDMEFRGEKEYERHLEELHPGWAMMLLQKMGMKIARENG
ncbi:MAG TPA: hypothetical protein VN577_13200 [Terriglobales bacterium]|nr:hypothetical protein [Terriglobales bacterium]